MYFHSCVFFSFSSFRMIYDREMIGYSVLLDLSSVS